MKLMKSLAVALAFALPSLAGAAYVPVTDVKIKSYKLQWASGYLFLMVTLDKNITGSTCSTSDSTDTFSYWIQGNTNDVMDRYLTFVIAAESMERKIELVYDNAPANCSAIGGAWIVGLSMLPLPAPAP